MDADNMLRKQNNCKLNFYFIFINLIVTCEGIRYVIFNLNVYKYGWQHQGLIPFIPQANIMITWGGKTVGQLLSLALHFSYKLMNAVLQAIKAQITKN